MRGGTAAILSLTAAGTAFSWLGLMEGCGSSSSAGPPDAQADVDIGETIALCPPSTPLSCNGQCVAQDSTHCASCTDRCAANVACKFGQCLCTNGTATCHGACVDTKTDGQNCGTCSHDCGGASCSEGICAPVQLAAANAPWGIATDGQRVFFTEQGDAGAVRGVLVDGGAPVTVAAAVQPRDIALFDGGVFWTDETAAGWEVHGAREDGSAAAKLYTGNGVSEGLDVLPSGQMRWIENDADGTHTIWSGYVTGAVATLSDSMGAGTLEAIASTETTSYVSGGGGIFRCDVSFACKFLATVGNAGQMALSQGVLYVTTGGVPGIIAIVSPSTGDVFTLIGNLGDPYGVAVDLTAAYVANRASGTVTKVGLSPIVPSVVAAAQSVPTHVALDDTFVYWTTHGAPGGVMRAYK